ncbi:MAG: HAD-IA family hydrolase [Deltaproteobacteria bacterium]|nr:HAD-IA family hydrolase [Deltaproteobacteria bacterium]
MTDQPRIRAVILDAGGVIVHPDMDWIAAGTRAYGAPLDVPTLYRAYYRMAFVVDQTPNLDRHGFALTTVDVRAWMFSHWLRGAGLAEESVEVLARSLAEAAAETFPRESDIYYWARPGLRALLEGLRARGFLLGSASNNDGALEAQLRTVGVLDLFSAYLDSRLEGVSKPDPELLLRTAQRLGVAPAECVYVGDLDRVDGEASRAAGMRFALLDPLAQPRPSGALLIPELDALASHFRAEP